MTSTKMIRLMLSEAKDLLVAAWQRVHVNREIPGLKSGFDESVKTNGGAVGSKRRTWVHTESFCPIL